VRFPASNFHDYFVGHAAAPGHARECAAQVVPARQRPAVVVGCEADSRALARRLKLIERTVVGNRLTFFIQEYKRLVGELFIAQLALRLQTSSALPFRYKTFCWPVFVRRPESRSSPLSTFTSCQRRASGSMIRIPVRETIFVPQSQMHQQYALVRDAT